MNDEGDYSDHESEEEEEEEEEEDEEEEEGERTNEEGTMMPLPKLPRNQSLDRISALHDSVLLHILSFLRMEDVVGTSALSRRWRNLWTSTSILVFKRGTYETLRKFVASVNGTLILCKSSNIKRFVLHIRCNRDDSFPPDVCRWIRFATNKNVEDLDLYFRTGAADCRLPQHLFTNSSLRILSLSSSDIVIAPSGPISWMLLKSLTLDSVYLSDGAIAKILSGCPVLEFLHMDEVRASSPLDINSASLKKLVLRQCLIGLIGYGEYVLEISAPNLQFIALLGNFQRCRFRLVNVSSLVKANLSFSGEHDGGPVPSAVTRRFWRGSRFLNFLLACMVFAFVISWLFHFNVPS